MILEGHGIAVRRVMSCSAGDDPSVDGETRTCLHCPPNQAGGCWRIRNTDDADSLASSVSRT